jgi:hypothetical protein
MGSQQSLIKYQIKFRDEKWTSFGVNTDELILLCQSVPAYIKKNEIIDCMRSDDEEKWIVIFSKPRGEKEHWYGEWIDKMDTYGFTMPVMKDDEGESRYFIPHHLIISFNENVSKEEAKKMFDEANMTIFQESPTDSQNSNATYGVAIPIHDKKRKLIQCIKDFHSKNSSVIKSIEPVELIYEKKFIEDEKTITNNENNQMKQ